MYAFPLPVNAEQEEHLKVIHGNFKKEISQLLEDCRGMIQGLENNHVELKGIVDKQSTVTLSVFFCWVCVMHDLCC